MMDIQTLLHEQNRFVIEHLGKHIDSHYTPEEREPVMDVYALSDLILFHIQLEERYIFTVLQKNPALSPLLDKMIAEHRRMFELIATITAGQEDEATRLEKTVELLACVKSHAHEDQKTFYTHACNNMPDEKTMQMADEINARIMEDLEHLMAPA